MIACIAALCITGAVAVDGDTLRVNTPGSRGAATAQAAGAPPHGDRSGSRFGPIARGVPCARHIASGDPGELRIVPKPVPRAVRSEDRLAADSFRDKINGPSGALTPARP